MKFSVVSSKELGTKDWRAEANVSCSVKFLDIQRLKTINAERANLRKRLERLDSEEREILGLYVEG